MSKSKLQIILFSILLFGMNACVSTDTSNINPKEKIFCDISTQLNGNDNSLKSEVRFYVKDSLDTRPYFLEAPVLVNGTEMDKKFIGHKGVYYTLTFILDDIDDVVFSFSNLDDKEYELVIPIVDVPKRDKNNFSIKEILDFKTKDNESYILVDAKNKMFEIPNKKNNIEQMALGDAQLVHVIKKEKSYQLKDKLWVKYNSKSLSHSQFIKVVKPSIKIVE